MNISESAEKSSTYLSDEHLAHLRDGSGISEDVIRERGYRTIEKRLDLQSFGFSAEQARTVPGILIPHYGPDGSNGYYQFKPDKPRTKYDKKKDKETVTKYENPAGAGVRLDVPPRCKADLANPDVELWITEGTKKADAGASHGLCIIALNGVWGFKGSNPMGGVTVLADWDYIALKGRTVNICFDSDVMTKAQVKQALERLTTILQRKGALVNQVYMPGGNDAKTGLDDYLLEHTVDELRALVAAPRETPRPAPVLIRLLRKAPSTITRPLSLLDGKAYAAIWPHTEETVFQSIGKDGSIVNHNPPIVRNKRRLMIVSGDGKLYGDGLRELSEIGAIIRLPEMPEEKKLWSTDGVERFGAGERPDPADVFKRIVEIVDRFIDFDRSLTDQRGMCELIACYILSTWFLDAFNLIGYLWPNGERGSGKTQLLLLLGEMGYLGQVILAGGSFPALRDMADYGALLCFDDAENLADPKTTDPDKRTLLLAGNRRGATIPLKEQGPDRTWKTRYVQTYCPRAYCAIKLPDPVLASRSITVPLVRSGDRNRANADPMEFNLWPHDRERLVDDLWALAVAHLPELSVYERKTNDTATLTGRNLEPWRAMLAVAMWLQDRGVEGIADRMHALSLGYQSERQDFEGDDITRLVMGAICAKCDECAGYPVQVATSDIAAEVKKQAGDDSWIADLEDRKLSIRVGKMLKRQRFNKAKRERNRGPQLWEFTSADIAKIKHTYSIFEENGGSTRDHAEHLAHLAQLGALGADLPENDRCRECGSELLEDSCPICSMECPF